MSDPIIIIGAGQAGLQASVSLRQLGYDGDLILIGDEDNLPYQRPPLSKKYLMGELTIDRLLLKPEAFFTDQNVSLRTGTRVTSISPADHTITLADGSTLTYSKLLIATGTAARLIPIPGHDKAGVVTLRNIPDVDRIKPFIKPGGKAAIIGGGYIGLEVAAVAQSLGMEVTVFEAAERLLQRVAAPQTSEFFFNLHTGHGVTIHLNAAIDGIAGDDQATGVRTKDGAVHEADVVLMATGAVPVTGLAEEAGIACDNGILVSERCETSAPDVFAAGDCVSFQSALYGRQIRLESVQNAIDQAKAAADAMLGGTPHYDPVPWFWSDQYDVKLQIAGLNTGYDTAEVRGSIENNSFGIVYSKDGKLLAVDTVNQPKGHMLARRAIGKPLTEYTWTP